MVDVVAIVVPDDDDVPFEEGYALVALLLSKRDGAVWDLTPI